MASMVGMCTLVSGEADSGLERTIRLRLTPTCLTVQEEVLTQVGSTNQFDASGLPVLREISLCRDHRGSFGFSVRGGSENRLPVLVSHVQKGMPAFKTKALFVGDAILRIDQASVEGATHDEVVERLKNAGQQVTLVVKHFREAAKLLHEQQSQSQSQSQSSSSAAAVGSSSSRTRRRTSSSVASATSGSSRRASGSAAAPALASVTAAAARDSSPTPPTASSRDNLLSSDGGVGGGAVVVDFSGVGEADNQVAAAAGDPWVPRAAAPIAAAPIAAAPVAAAPAAAVKAPIASESFSTFHSSSSTGSTQLPQQQPQLRPQPLNSSHPSATSCSQSSTDSLKVSLLPAAPATAAPVSVTADAATCTVFANRNANRNAQNRTGNSHSALVEPQQQQQQLRSWLDVMTVPLKYGRVTRYQPNSDQLRRHSFEVIGLNGHSTGCLTFASYEDFNKWFAEVNNNIRLLMEAEVSSFNERIGVDFPAKTEPLVHMCWLGLTLHDSPQLSRLWQDVFLALRGDDLLLFEVPPIFLDDWRSASVKEKVYKCVIRVLDDEELLDKRLNAFFLHCGSAHTFYMSAETVGEVSRLERCWFRATSNTLAKKSASGSPVVFKVSHNGEDGQLVFDLDKGVSFTVGHRAVWAYKFSCLKRSYDDRDRTLYLHFQDPAVATADAPADVKEVQVPDLQLLLIVLHSFLSSKLTAVDPQFLKR